MQETCSFIETIKSVLVKNNLDDNRMVLYDDKDYMLPMHKFHLESLLDNLIRNGIKFRRENEAPQLRVTVEEDASNFKFRVEDNGIGIDDSYRERIFDIFKRLEKNRFSGTGMGLAICKKIVQTYSGNIWVSKNSPFGSIFHFTISKE